MEMKKRDQKSASCLFHSAWMRSFPAGILFFLFLFSSGASETVYQLDASSPVRGMRLTEKSTWITESAKTASTGPVPAKPFSRVDAILSLRIASGSSLTRYPQFADLFPFAVSGRSRVRVLPKPFPFCQVAFYSPQMKIIRKSGGESSHYPLYDTFFRTVKLEFDVPDQAAFFEIQFVPNAEGNVIELASARFESRDPFGDRWRNINCDFSFGEFNPSGYWTTIGFVWRVDPAGKPFLDLDEGEVYTNRFPVRSGETLHYEIDADTESRIVLVIDFFRSCGESARSAIRHGPVIFRPAARGSDTLKTGEVIVPEGSRWCYFRLSGGTLSFVKVAARKHRSSAGFHSK